MANTLFILNKIRIYKLLFLKLIYYIFLHFFFFQTTQLLAVDSVEDNGLTWKKQSFLNPNSANSNFYTTAKAQPEKEISNNHSQIEENWNLSDIERISKIILSKHIKTDIKASDLYKAGINGILEYISEKETENNEEKMQKIDYDHIISDSDLKNINGKISGKINGVGCIIEENEGKIFITEVFPNTPASKADIHILDQIIQINGFFIEKLNIDDVINLFRNESKDYIDLRILRKQKYLDIRVFKSMITIPDVFGEMLDLMLGFIKINSFSQETPKKIAALLKAMKEYKPNRIIIDLRQNTGGKLESVLQTLDLFLPSGVLIAQIEDKQKNRQKFYSQGKMVLDSNITILVDNQTRSSAELFAITLKEQRQATLLGKNTYGKTNIEEIIEIKKGFYALIPTKKLYSPLGKTWEQTGLYPDKVFIKTSNSSFLSTKNNLLQDPLIQYVLLKK